jgi:hypothetical protein
MKATEILGKAKAHSVLLNRVDGASKDGGVKAKAVRQGRFASAHGKVG